MCGHTKPGRAGGAPAPGERPVRSPHWNSQVLDRSLPDQGPAQKLELRELVLCLPVCQAAGDTLPAGEGRPRAGQDGAAAGPRALTLC